jgi:hypothetical protein
MWKKKKFAFLARLCDSEQQHQSAKVTTPTQEN